MYGVQCRRGRHVWCAVQQGQACMVCSAAGAGMYGVQCRRGRHVWCAVQEGQACMVCSAAGAGTAQSQTLGTS